MRIFLLHKIEENTVREEAQMKRKEYFCVSLQKKNVNNVKEAT